MLVAQVKGQTPLYFDHHGIAEGLLGSSVNTIVSGPQGSIWAGTQEGLNEFDGFEFHATTKEKHPELKSAYILSSDRDDSGNLWFGTKKELLYFQANKRQFTSYKNPFNSYSVRQVICAGERIYLLHGNQQIYVFNTRTKRFIGLTMTFSAKQLIKGLHGVYAISGEHRMYRLNMENTPIVFYQSAAETLFSGFSVKGKMVLFMLGKTRVIDEGNPTIQNPLFGWDSQNNATVTGLVAYRDGFAIGTQGNGLFILENGKNPEQVLVDPLQPQGLKSKVINTLYTDQNQLIWIGSEKGLSCFSTAQSPWTHVGPSSQLQKGLPTENVWSFYETKNRLWVGTDRGISVFNKLNNSFTHYPHNPKFLSQNDGTVMSIKPLTEDRFLVACFDGLFIFNSNTGKFNPIFSSQEKLQQRHPHFYHMLEHNGRILVATSSGILSVDKQSQKVAELYFQPDNPIRYLYQDSQGNLWCVSDQNGLSSIDRESYLVKEAKVSSTLKGIVTDPFSCMVEFEKNILWIGTHGSGMLSVHLQTGVIKIIDRTWGLSNNFILGITKDAFGQFWVSTNAGLARFSSKNNKFEAYVPFELGPIEYNANALFADLKGKVYIGGGFGYSSFNSLLEKQEYYPSFPLINEVRLKRISTAWPSGRVSVSELENRAFTIAMPYHARDFEICFQPNSLYQSKQMEYKCEMIGETTDTIYLGHTNHVSFNSLASGTYYLRIYSRKGRHGAWTETPALLTVIIQPPFWASKPFLGTTLVLFIFSGFVAVRLRIRKEQKEKMALEQLVQERTKEIQQQRDEIEEKNVRINEEKNKVLQQQQLLYKEKEVAEKWLSNALPEQAIKELQRLGKVKAKSFESATILFTDLVGFSKTSESMSPARLVNKLDSLVRKFDSIIKDSKIEKIKTIGDAYMAVGGIPERNTTHPIDVCLAALKIKEFMLKHKYEALANGKDFWEIRMGINTGPVTAGVIGRLKIAYDVWGAAVNQAQRMEQNAEPGTISISESTFLLVEPYFEFIHKGKAAMKTKTRINRYELVRIKPDLSLRGEGILPNDLFYEIQQLYLFSPIKYYSVEMEVLKMLEEQLPQNLYYHCAEHTREVIHAVEHLALSEGVRDEGLFLLKTAALFHDLGFTQQYEHNESIGVDFAKQILPKFGYSELHINTVAELIFATEVPHKPVNKLQEIICDADLDYLGTDNFEEISQKLKLELMEKGKITSDRQWDELQIPFLQNHRYYTETAILTRAPKKQENLERVMARLEANAYS